MAKQSSKERTRTIKAPKGWKVKDALPTYDGKYVTILYYQKRKTRRKK